MKVISLTLAALCAVINLASPRTARAVPADASANASLFFNNLIVTPTGGSFVLVTNWSAGVFAQATGSNVFGGSTVSVTGDHSTASGSADLEFLTAGSSANASVTGAGADNAEGQGWLTTLFMITGGSGSVSTTFSVDINSLASVLTDANGQLAMAENVFSLELDGNPVLFNDQFFSVGPSDSGSQNLVTTLSGFTTLQYNTTYMLFIQADSEVSVSSVPEPGTVGLLAAGAVVCLWFGRKKLRGHLRGISALVLLFGAGGVAQATYIGGDAPDICLNCGGQPTRQTGGTVATSLTEGNLQENYPVATLESSSGPTVQLALDYNSYNADGSKAQVDSGVGFGWTHSYNQFMFNQRGSYFQMGPDGRVTLYKYTAGGTYTTDSGYFETLYPQPNGSLTVSNKFQSWWHFEYVANTHFQVQGLVYRLTQMGDRNGNVTTLLYTNGLLAQIVDTYGRALTLTYTNQHLWKVIDPLGRTTTFQYDSKFRTPVMITDPNGKVTRYTYNPNYQMTKKIDRDGRTYSYLYRNLKPWAVMDGNGQTYFYMQNSNNWAVDRTILSYALRRIYPPSTVTNVDGNGYMWRYQYDTNGYITRTIAPDGATTSYAYDPRVKKLTATTNANGAVTRYQYDSQGNRTNLTDALGNVTTYRYDPVYNQMTSMTDANGRTTTYQYDAHGNRTNEIDPLLQTQSWAYDTHGNLTRSTDRNSHTTTYIYDEDGNCTNTTDALGHTTTFTYDGNGNRTSTTDALGRTTTYTYDGLNRVTGQTNALGGVTAYDYDGASRQTTNTDVNGHITTYAYDTRGRLTRSVDANGGSTTYGYDGNNNRTAVTNQLGNPTLFYYDSQNRRIATADALGGVTTFTYDAAGNLTTNTDNNGHSTTYTYDSLNRRVAQTDALGYVTRYDYASPGGPPCCTPTPGSSLITRQEDANHRVTFYVYDELDRMVEIVKKQGNTNAVITPSDAVTVYTYDPAGNRLTVTDPVGNTVTNTYDSLNRVIGITNAAGDITASAYDPVGNLVTSTAPNGNVTTYVYDGLNRMTRAADSAGLLTTNAYDPAGNRLSATDPNGHTTSYIYDNLNRQTTMTDAMGQPTVTTYDGVGNVITNVDRNGNVTSYHYDSLNRRTATYDAQGNTTTYAYDAAGSVTNITDANGHTTSYSYDSVNRRVTEAYPDPAPNTVTYTYDGVGNRITRTDQQGRVTTYSYSELYYPTNRSYTPGGSTENFTYDLSGRMLSADRNGWLTTFGYDGANRLVYTTQNGEVMAYSYDIAGRVQTNAYPSGRVIRQAYDARNRLLTRQDVGNPPIVAYTYDAADRVLTRTNRNGVATTYAYDADNRITSLETSNSVGRVVGFGYAYDFEGNRLSELKRHAAGDSEAYVYDALYRLTNYDVGTLSGNTVPLPAPHKAWNLDPLGNWSSVISNTVTETRTHGPANELLAIDAQVFAYDASGNLQQDSGCLYSYDEENRLTQVRRLSDSAIVGRYLYDALGRRVVSIVNPAGVAATNVFFYDRQRLIEEQNVAGGLLASYVYGDYVDEVVTMDRGGQTCYYHQNALWSPHALTDAAGNVVERYTYDVYGQVEVLDAGYSPLPLNSWGTPHSAVGNPYLFTGRELDEEAGLYFYRARSYDCVKGRFLQRDPFERADQLNLYEYVGGRPTSFVDPTGLQAEVAAAAVGAGITVFGNVIQGGKGTKLEWDFGNHTALKGDRDETVPKKKKCSDETDTSTSPWVISRSGAWPFNRETGKFAVTLNVTYNGCDIVDAWLTMEAGSYIGGFHKYKLTSAAGKIAGTEPGNCECCVRAAKAEIKVTASHTYGIFIDDTQLGDYTWQISGQSGVTSRRGWKW